MNLVEIKLGFISVNEEDEKLLKNIYNDFIGCVVGEDKIEVENSFSRYLERRSIRFKKGESGNLFELIKLLEEDLLMIKFYVGELEECLEDDSKDKFNELMKESLARREEKVIEIKGYLMKITHSNFINK